MQIEMDQSRSGFQKRNTAAKDAIKEKTETGEKSLNIKKKTTPLRRSPRINTQREAATGFVVRRSDRLAQNSASKKDSRK